MRSRFAIVLLVLIFSLMFSCQSGEDQVESYTRDLLSKEGILDDYTVRVYRCEDGSFYVSVIDEKIQGEQLEKLEELNEKTAKDRDVSAFQFPGGFLAHVSRDKETSELEYGTLEDCIEELR